MKTSRLINTLKTFSKEEMKLFEKFLASPFHNSGKNCTPLFRQLQKCYPDFKTEKITYESLHKKLYPGRKFNKQVMWNLASAMEKMTKEFLEQIALRKNRFSRMELALSEFGIRKLYNHYSQTISKMEKLLEFEGVDYDFFDKQLHLENFKQEYYLYTDKVQFKGDSTLKSSEYQIMLFLRMTVAALKDLKILEEYHNYKLDVNVPLEFAKNLDLERIVDYANRKNFEYAYLIEIYYLSLMMHLEPQKREYLDRFRELYRKHYKKLSKGEQSDLMHWLINYCLYNLDMGENKNRRIVFELNEFRLKEGLAFYPENQLSKAIYLQILSTALEVNETEWALNFIKEYTIKLLPESRDSIRCMAYAYLYFHTKEYSKVLKNLNKVEFIDIRDKLQTRVISAKSYYELGEIETLLHYIDASKHFLINNPSVSGIVRIHAQNFFKYINKIVFTRENMNTGALHILRYEIEKVEEVSAKKWLIEKIDELGNGNKISLLTETKY